MVNDRGTKKWTAMMLPEHQQALQEMWEQDEWMAKPILDEQLIAEINLKLQVALEHDLTIEIEYFKNHKSNTVKGKLLGVDPFLNYVRMNDEEIKLDAITGVTIE